VGLEGPFTGVGVVPLRPATLFAAAIALSIFPLLGLFLATVPVPVTVALPVAVVEPPIDDRHLSLPSAELAFVLAPTAVPAAAAPRSTRLRNGLGKSPSSSAQACSRSARFKNGLGRFSSSSKAY
jgi:hypothetical protein